MEHSWVGLGKVEGSKMGATVVVRAPVAIGPICSQSDGEPFVGVVYLAQVGAC